MEISSIEAVMTESRRDKRYSCIETIGNRETMNPWTPVEVPPVEDTEAYIEYVNETMQDLPDEIFNRPEEDEGNYEEAIEKLNEIKEKIYKEMVESDEREEIISLIDDLIAYLESLL